MLKIGVTGVDGFLGNKIYEHLLISGYEVVGFSRRNKNSKFIYWDIKTKAETLPEIDVMVHCAGVVDDWTSYKMCYENNCIGTQNVLNAFPTLSKFIYISTCSVYDVKNLNPVLDEFSLCGNFLNGYSRSKYEAEQIILNHSSLFQKIILRPHAIYGTGDKKLIPRLLRAHRFGRFIVIGDGENYISITHVDNLCLAIKKSIEENCGGENQIFNITDMDAIKVKNLLTYVKNKFHIKASNFYLSSNVALLCAGVAEYVFKLFGISHAPTLTKYAVHQISSNHIISIKKAQSMLKYNPSKSILDF